jgi:cobalt-zinc-cadmium efflux system outer membrane protein
VKSQSVICAFFLLVPGLLYAQHSSMPATPLKNLLAEAEAQNSQIASADSSWKASTYVTRQVTTLPDPQFSVQTLSVGSPVPFAGFSNSDFAYIGFGASQDLPYPGKRKLKGNVADREAETQKSNAQVVRSSIAEQVKMLYLRLAYSDAALAILHQTDEVLQSIIKDALSRYSLGQGSQSGVIKAQLEHTKILREETMHHGEVGQLQADLKQLLHRPQDSPDIVAEPLTATSFLRPQNDLREILPKQNPALLMDAAAVAKQDAQLSEVKSHSKPDFNIGYTFQLTGSKYRDYYMLTVGMRLPRRSRVAAEVSEATETINRNRKDLDSDTQLKLADLQKQYVAVTSTAELMDEYKNGLIPQSEAAFRSEQGAYQANKQEFAPVLSSLMDLLTMEHDYQEALFNHETALVRIETLTGEALR